MVKYMFVVMLGFLTLAKIDPASKNPGKTKAATATKSVSVRAEQTVARPQETDTLAVITSPSSAGEVTFPHQMHYEDLEFECETCHHETNAAELEFPHEDYFDDFWIDCKICHNGNDQIEMAAQACSKCHHDSPATITDETLSAKVVTHQSCWECHEAEKGLDASKNCKFCHSGPRMKF